ncbi:MAG: PAS domain S-box protein [Deltaproteobacteria bacterium]|nr:PAS domain S-box protein [Deltaproteobacteria bacterium]
MDILSVDTIMKFQRFIAPAPDHISIVSRDYRYMVVNDVYLAAHGRKREEIVGRTVADLLGEEIFLRIKGYLDSALAGEVVNFSAWIDFAGTGRRYMNVVYYPFIGEDGEVSGIVVNSRDLTELKDAQERLRQSEEKYRHLFEHLNDAALLADASTGVLLETNKKGEELLGRPREEIIGMHQSALHPSGKAEEYRGKFALHVDRGKLADYVGEVERKDGTIVIVHISAEALSLGDKKLILGIFRDLTEVKKLEAEMLKAQKLESIGLLAGGIAHEFNNILTGIYGNISLAKMMLCPTGKPYEAILRAESASLRAGDLTKQLLTFSRGGAPVKKAVSIAPLIPEWCAVASRGAQAKCEYDIDEHLRDAYIDEGQVSQAVRNLVMNAVEAMDGSGVVRVAARNEDAFSDGLTARKGGYVTVSIGDEGRGIKEEDLPRIFDPFFTTKERGSGLGLSAVYSIVKGHEGHLTVKSAPGRGSVFIMYLPAALKTVDNGEAGGGLGTSGKKVLLMDDEEMIRELAAEILPSLGYEVEVSRDGDEAVKKYTKAKEAGVPFDLVILDLTVPGGTGGKEALARLKEMDPGVKAMVSSGYSNDPIMADYGRYGLKGAIAKPFNMKGLSEAVRSALSDN